MTSRTRPTLQGAAWLHQGSKGTGERGRGWLQRAVRLGQEADLPHVSLLGHCHEEGNVWQVCLLTEAHGPLEPPTPPLSCPLASLMQPRCTLKCGACARGHALRTRPDASGEAEHDTAGTPPSYSARTPRMDGSAVTFGSRGHRICRRPARRARTGL